MINEYELKRLFTDIKNKNDNKSFDTLYEKYKKMVYGIAYGILKNKDDSEDIVQTVFTKIYNMPKEQLPSFNTVSWLYSVIKNESISLLRKRRNDIDTDSIYEIEDADNEINNIIDKIEFNRLISKLDNKEKEIVSLKILSGFSFDEMAKLLNKPVGTVKWKYYKSIHTLKILLGNLGMFIITFIIGIKAVFNDNRESIKDEEKVEVEKEEVNAREEFKENSRKESLSENLQKSEETQEIIEVQSSNNYFEWGIFSASGIFLIITIIFLVFYTKYQLKLKVKTSK